MSFLTAINNFRINRKVSQLTKNAAEQEPQKIKSWRPVLGLSFALAFMFMLVAVQPAAAVTINLSVITDVINAFIGILEPITNLIIAIVPLWFVLQILAFIMGLMGAVLAMIKFGKH